MTQKNPIINPTSISRDEKYPAGQDYQALLKKGYELIAQYSGSLWTNYNDSDPGITILQNLCYTLTELGYKANLPIADLLCDEQGRIPAANQFHSPGEVYCSNPVLLSDFSKLLLNAIPELKQVYFTQNSYSSTFAGLQAWLEVKPEYVPLLSSDVAFENRISQMAGTLLIQHGNVSQTFLKPRVLIPHLVKLSGRIQIDKDVPVEKTLASVIFSCNNFFSPYPHYQSYVELIKAGADPADLLQGPFLDGGFIDDELIATKRDQLTVHEINAVCLSTEGVISASLDDSVLPVSFSFDECPCLTIQSLSEVEFLQCGKRVSEYDLEKVRYYLNRLVPTQKNSALTDLWPVGSYRNLSQYYSIQNSFPSIYQLTGKGPSTADHLAKVNQLKAYLFLFEQHFGNYLAQLKGISSLLSFNSGKTDYRLTSATYYHQALFDVPGMDRIMEGVSDYCQAKGASGMTDWVAYRQDSENPYEKKLTDISNDTDNISRKKRALEHLLARYGKKYDPQYLRFANPHYGTDTIAEVEFLSHTLKSFPVLSANRARSYFHSCETESLKSGIELNLDNDLGFISFLTGVTDAIQQSLSTGQGIEVVYYNAMGIPQCIFPKNSTSSYPKGKPDTVEVIWNNESLISFKQITALTPMGLAEVSRLLSPYLSALTTLAKDNRGQLFVDTARLTEFLSFRWSIHDDSGKILYTSVISADRLSFIQHLLEGTLPLEVKEITPNEDYEVGVKTSQSRYVICSNLEAKEDAQALVDCLNQWRLRHTSNTFTVEVVSSGESTTVSWSMLNGKSFIILPDWISYFNQSGYRDVIVKKAIQLCPATTTANMFFLSHGQFEIFLTFFQQWMTGLSQAYKGHKIERRSRNAAFEIVKILSTELSTDKT